MFWLFFALAAALVFLGIGNTFRLIGTLIGLVFLAGILYVGGWLLFIGLLSLIA
jgi:hypothetical protein